ncbi:MAG: hypothetical protein DUD39_18445, partial [Coriobacteriaceae bacterium]
PSSGRQLTHFAIRLAKARVPSDLSDGTHSLRLCSCQFSFNRAKSIAMGTTPKQDRCQDVLADRS